MEHNGQREMDLVPTFAEAIAPHHRRIDSDDWDDIYIIGDVHGCLDAFQRLLAKLEIEENDLVICVGDIVRKGPDSAGALSLVRDRENVLSVRGNNEQGLIDGTKSDPALDDDDFEYIESLPLAISFDDALVVHGGINHRKAVEEHGTTDLLEMRSLTGSGYDRPYWFETRSERPRVFFGHTVLSEPFASPVAVGLDTGCVYGGRLTAYDWDAETFVSVEPTETYRDRSDDSIVDPHPPEHHAERP